MGWDSAFSLADKIFGRWFSKEAVKEKRRNKIKKLEKEIDKVLKGDVSDKSARKLTSLRKRLSQLRQDASND